MAGALDVFSIAFESDTLKEFEANLKRNEKELDNYEKKVKEAEEALEKLRKEGKTDSVEFKKLQKSLEESSNKVEMFKTNVETMKKSAEHSLLQVKNNFLKLTKTVARLAIVGATIKKSLDFYEQGEQLQFLAQKAGVASEKLQTLGNAARRYGGTTEGTAGTLENLRSQYQSLIMGQGGGGLEQASFKYGVSISSDPEKMLENVARRMETLKSDAAKWDLANEMGIDEGTARLLMQGTKAYTEELKRAQKYKLYTKEDLERMRQYRQISLDIRMGIDSIFASIARMLLPVIEQVAKVIRTITDWMIEHEGAVQLIAILAGVTMGTLALKNGVELLSGAVGLLGKSLKGLNLLGWGLVITLIFGFIEDLYVFMQGGNSLLGELWKSWGYDLEKIRVGMEIWCERIKRLWNNFLATFDKKRQRIEDPMDKDVMKKQSLENERKIRENQLKNENKELAESIKNQELSISRSDTGLLATIRTWSMAKGEMYRIKRHGSKFDSVSPNAITNYNQTQAINETNNKNTENIVNSNTNNNNRSNSNTRVTNINTMNVNLQTNNPQEFLDNLGVAADLDNGIVSG